MTTTRVTGAEALTAAHEAAHAVVALLTGTRFREVHIRPIDPAYDGALEQPDAPTARALAVTICAGLLVDLSAGELHRVDRSDFAELLNLAPELATETGRDVADACVDALEEASRLLHLHRDAVQRVTDALLVDGRLSEEQAQQVAALPSTTLSGRTLA